VRRWLRLLGVLVVVAVGGLLVAWLLFRNQALAADREPGPLETAIARRLVRLSIPADARRAVNPNATGGEAWRDGAIHFQQRCAFCHGGDGRGQSPVATRMYPPVPDLASAPIQQMSDGEIFAVIEHGVRWTGMPAFRGMHDAAEIWDLVSFVRRVPELTSADLQAVPGAAAPPDGAASADASVAMDGTTFVPGDVAVSLGETVEWTNKDPFPHNVASTAAGFASQDLQPGETWQFTPKTAGRYPYVCTLHPGMAGTLIVSTRQQSR
jgi:plastocyanin